MSHAQATRSRVQPSRWAAVLVCMGITLGYSAGWAAPAAVSGGAEAASAALPLPITVSAVLIEHADGPIRGYVAAVDLTDPGVEVVISGDGRPEAMTGVHALDVVEGAEAVLTPTDRFAIESGCALAVNANFFAWMEDLSGKKTVADIIGLSITDGDVISPPRSFDSQDDPALVFTRTGRAGVGRFGEAGLAGSRVWDGVAGIGGSPNSDVPGTLLVKDGVNLGETARVAPLVRHPRTAAGVNRDGTVLVLAVIDGRQPGHSIGINLPELADLMIEHGADDALNLDGGGSSAFVCWGGVAPGLETDDRGWIVNSPSDGRFRAVANSVGVRVAGLGPAAAPEAEGNRREHAEVSVHE